MFSYSPSAYLPSYTYAVAPDITNPRDRYLAALAEVKAAEANYRTVEAARREEEALTRRLEEIRLRRQEETLRAPYSNQFYQQLSKLEAYQAIYGPNYLGAFERDHIHTAALAQRHRLKAGLGCCPFDDCASSCGFQEVNSSTAKPTRSPFDPLDNYGSQPRIVVRSQPYTSHPTRKADNRALLKLLFGAYPHASTPTLHRRCPARLHPHTDKVTQASRAQSLEEYYKTIEVLPVEQTPRSSLTFSEIFSEDNLLQELSDIFRTPAAGEHSEKAKDKDEFLSLKGPHEAKLLEKFADMLRTGTTSKTQTSNSTAPKPAEAPTATPAVSRKTEEPTTATSADIRSSLAKIRSIETAFNTLKNNFLFPAELDFNSPTSSPSSSPSYLATSDSEKPTTTERLSYSPRNRAVHSYEHELTVLLTQLDSVESLGDEGIRASRKEVVGRVENALEDLEKELEGRWRISVSGCTKADGVGTIPELDLDTTNPNSEPSSQAAEDTETLSPSKEVRFNEAAYVITGPFPVEPSTEDDTASTTSTSDNEWSSDASTQISPTTETQIEEVTTSGRLAPTVHGTDANAVEPTANIPHVTEHSVDALQSLAPAVLAVCDIDDFAPEVVVDEVSAERVPELPIPITLPTKVELGASPTTFIENWSLATHNEEVSTDTSSVATPSLPTLPALPSSDGVGAEYIPSIASEVDDAFLLTRVDEDSIVQKPNVDNNDDEWLEVSA